MNFILINMFTSSEGILNNGGLDIMTIASLWPKLDTTNTESIDKLKITAPQR